MAETPNEADLNALDVTDAEAAEINSIAHPLVPDAAPDADDDLVQIDSTTDGVVFVTINRPAKKNAFDAATIAALHEAFETLHGADRVRAVFIRGAGGTFSAGADLNWMRDAAGLVRERQPRRRHGPGENAEGAARHPRPDGGGGRGQRHGRGRGHRRRLRHGRGGRGRALRLLRGQAGSDSGDHRPLCDRGGRRAPRPASCS